jgi:hypothetical protein
MIRCRSCRSLLKTASVRRFSLEYELTDRDDIADIILTSPATGKGLEAKTTPVTVDCKTILVVGNDAERWTVEIVMKEEPYGSDAWKS